MSAELALAVAKIQSFDEESADVQRGDVLKSQPKLVRSISHDVASLTGRPQAMARKALDALGEDEDSACHLLLSGLALAVLDSLPCEVEELQPGILAWLSKDKDARQKIVSPGAFSGCFLLRVARGRREPLHLFALEPVDVCLLRESGAGASPEAAGTAASSTPGEGWTELEYTEPPKVEGFCKNIVVHSASFDPGPVEVPLQSCGDGGTLAIVRIVKKEGIVPPRPSLKSRRRAREQPRRKGDTAEHAKDRQPSPSPLPAAKRATKQVSYHILREIGQGAFGKVFLAEEVKPESASEPVQLPGVGSNQKRKLALKQVSARDHHKAREAELLGKIRHPCVIELVDSYSEKREGELPVFCIVMEYMPMNLHQKIDGQPLGVSDVRCFGFQLLRAMAHLDGVKICHRDLKPENVLLQPHDRSLKVADFGSAKVLGDGPSTSYICSRWWRAPELVLGATRYTTGVDWWSCGCIAAEMMLGRPLFTGESSWSQMYEIVRALGTPTLEEVRALQAGSEGRMAGHFLRLAELARPARAWEDLLPAFAGTAEALEFPAAMLTLDPRSRSHPAEVMRASFFRALPTDNGPLPPRLFDFTEEELSSCSAEAKTELRSLSGGLCKEEHGDAGTAAIAAADSQDDESKKRPFLVVDDDECGPKQKRRRLGKAPPAEAADAAALATPGGKSTSVAPPTILIRLESEDLRDIP